MVITGYEKLSETAERFYTLLKSSFPNLLRFATVVSPSDDNPYVEPNSIILVIPARDGFLFDTLYLETRPEDILIAMGIVPHIHFSWWSKDVIDKQMWLALQFVTDVLSEQIIFIKRKALLSRNEYWEAVRSEDLRKEMAIVVYSWNGTYDTASGWARS